MVYELLEHSTDALVEVRAPTMNGALQDAAYSAIDIMLQRDVVARMERYTVHVAAPTLHEMLYEWLEEIVFQVVTVGFAIRDVDVTYSDADNTYGIDATLYGEPLDVDKHRFGVEIKAPTYHRMHIDTSDMIMMRFLMDL